ncbi:DHA2 family efflux MFS transporter permease subunit [Kribbella sandramycini]|uniref:DHA2 family efflux MFS transporter permease subunit n=1 Tax=Kribbella sandramycini TaxID=60450 RepID=A0A7Y4P4G2_9ACTN|nr:MFS transporter [Kribbella sandramycini]MBB6566095.1 EmrB/QacA subfamily drug resistance transporter [Kribbella sandramycini]NOL45095.1 DHA2 family efflux MFS transporter permease subunit [Kribbella sandramycini]
MTAVAALPRSTATAAPRRLRKRWLAFSAVMTAAVMDLLDSTVMNVAAPAIRADLGGSYASLQWMAAGYTMALAVLLLVGGRLGDLVGRKNALLIGVAGFTVMSLLCGLAISPEMLIASRVLQGAFAAVMLPQGFGLVRDLFEPDERTKAFGFFGPIMGLSAVLGPIIGGTLLDLNLFGTGWRSIFLVNIPVGIFTFVVAAKHLPNTKPAANKVSLDVTGLLIATAGLVALVYPLVQGHEIGWPLWSKLLLVASLPILAIFGVHQARRSGRGLTSLIEPRLLKSRPYLSGVFFAVVFFGAMAGTFVLGMFLQVGLGYTPIHASLAMAPWALGALVGSAISGMTMQKFGRKLLHIGLALMALGLAGTYAVLSLTGLNVSQWDIAIPTLFGGIGMGMVFVPLFDIILSGVRDDEVGSATGMLGSFEQVGIALGIAVIGTIFMGKVSHADAAHRALNALDGTQTALLATIGGIALAFAAGFLLPKSARAGIEH